MEKGKIGIKQLREFMNQSRTKIYSISDIANTFGINFRAAENVLHRLRIEGSIHRHIDKNENNEYQFAVTMAENKIEKYVKLERALIPVISKKRKKHPFTVKEIKSLFAENFNSFAKLEDAVMFLLERGDELEKEMNHIKTVLNKAK